MATVIRQPGGNTTPDATLGGVAVTGNTNTGHAATTAVCASIAGALGSDSDSQAKSCRWHTFSAGPGGAQSVKLQLSWSASGTAGASADSGDGGSATGEIDFQIDYTVNGGSNWTNIVSEVKSANDVNPTSVSINNSSSANITLSVGQDLTQVQVRSRTRGNSTANGGNETSASGSASLTLTVSGIQIEIQTSAGIAILAGGM